METREVPYEAVVFVCTNVRDEDGRVSCAGHGRPGAVLREKLKEAVAARGLKGRVRVSASGCMDLCEQGPNVMVFTNKGGRTFYSGVSEADLPKIIASLPA